MGEDRGGHSPKAFGLAFIPRDFFVVWGTGRRGASQDLGEESHYGVEWATVLGNNKVEVLDNFSKSGLCPTV